MQKLDVALNGRGYQACANITFLHYHHNNFITTIISNLTVYGIIPL